MFIRCLCSTAVRYEADVAYTAGIVQKHGVNGDQHARDWSDHHGSLSLSLWAIWVWWVPKSVRINGWVYRYMVIRRCFFVSGVQLANPEYACSVGRDANMWYHRSLVNFRSHWHYARREVDDSSLSCQQPTAGVLSFETFAGALNWHRAFSQSTMGVGAAKD